MSGIEYKEIKPPAALARYVDSFWMLSNNSDEERPVVIMPDGRIDLIFSPDSPDELILLGIESEPSAGVLTPQSTMVAVSFTLLGMEYLFDKKFPSLFESAYTLSSDYFGLTSKDYGQLEEFSTVLTARFLELLPHKIDERKQKLFDLIYGSSGSMTISEISEKLSWMPRQMNRYFHEHFGLSLKAYCTILRFRASFQHVKEGKLFPQESFSDQAHFIKNVKKFAGVTPKELSKNENDRFIQFSVLKGN